MYEIIRHSEHYFPPCDDEYSMFPDEVVCDDVIAYVATETLAAAYVKYKNETEYQYSFAPRVTYEYREATPPEIIEAAFVLYIGDSTKPYRIFFSEEEMNTWLEGKKRKYRIEQLH